MTAATRPTINDGTAVEADAVRLGTSPGGSEGVCAGVSAVGDSIPLLLLAPR